MAASAQAVFEAAAAHVSPEGVPGATVLVARGGDVQTASFGTLGPGRGPVTDDTLWRIASTTKPITAATVLALVGEGALALDDPVARWLPELAAPRVLADPAGPLDQTVAAAAPVTVRGLLSFTFGFGAGIDLFTAEAEWPVVEAAAPLATLGPPDPTIPFGPDEWVERFGALPLMAQPGERWLYNTGMSLAGVLAGRAGGSTLGQVMRERVLGPLGMADTAFGAVDPERLATAVRPTADGLAVGDGPDGPYARAPRFEDGAAGLVSSAHDLHRFAATLLARGGPVLPTALVDEMLTDQLAPAVKSRGALLPGWFDDHTWGLGLAIADDGAYGWDGGLGTSFLVDPARDLVVIVLTQRQFESPRLPAIHADAQAAARGR